MYIPRTITEQNLNSIFRTFESVRYSSLVHYLENHEKLSGKSLSKFMKLYMNKTGVTRVAYSGRKADTIKLNSNIQADICKKNDFDAYLALLEKGRFKEGDYLKIMSASFPYDYVFIVKDEKGEDQLYNVVSYTDFEKNRQIRACGMKARNYDDKFMIVLSDKYEKVSPEKLALESDLHGIVAVVSKNNVELKEF